MSNKMLNDVSLEERVTGVIRRVLIERSINRAVFADDDLRAVGLTSLDMIGLVLSVEAEFNVMILENEITPKNFRSIRSISAMVASMMS
jgi:acyl carrier protein